MKNLIDCGLINEEIWLCLDFFFNCFVVEEGFLELIEDLFRIFHFCFDRNLILKVFGLG